MKLRNKKTGEIIDFGSPAFIIDNNKNNVSMQIKNLAELNEEWEDYQEPKEYWYIRDFSFTRGDTTGIGHSPDSNNDTAEYRKQIGNYFETREESEKAVEKLKAWKRLKDKGFRFEGIAGITNEIYFKANEQFTHIMVDEYTADKTEKEYIDDLMLLFGGKE